MIREECIQEAALFLHGLCPASGPAKHEFPVEGNILGFDFDF
jgi:hypothetical protein